MDQFQYFAKMDLINMLNLTDNAIGFSSLTIIRK